MFVSREKRKSIVWIFYIYIQGQGCFLLTIHMTELVVIDREWPTVQPVSKMSLLNICPSLSLVVQCLILVQVSL